MIELAIGVAALLALVSWAVRRSRRGPAGPPPERHPGIDIEELEAAEREARDAGRGGVTGDDEADEDWGPGVPRRNFPA